MTFMVILLISEIELLFSEEFKQKYSEHYTPVPGGVGPMTVAALMHNTYEAAVWRERYIYGKEIF